MSEPGKHVVDVWGEKIEISVHRKYKTVWIAVGQYKGERIEVKDRSERAAAMAWKEAARYKGG